MASATDSIVRMIDHSLLHPTLTEAEIRTGCELARELGTASVCVQPWAVALAAEVLRGSPVAVGAVVGFPQGANLTETKLHEARAACLQGAKELDMVVNLGKVKGGDWAYVERDVQAVVDAAHEHEAITKVIFENDFLDGDEDKIRLCEICQRAGAEYVKTSTGFGFVKQPGGGYAYQGATEHDLRLMRAHTPATMGVKAAGGVRTYEDAVRAREAGATRIGATATAEIAAGERRAQGDR